jgi:hypothetical protein
MENQLKDMNVKDQDLTKDHMGLMGHMDPMDPMEENLDHMDLMDLMVNQNSEENMIFNKENKD